MDTKHRSVAYCLGKTTERGTLKESFVTGDQQHIEIRKVHQAYRTREWRKEQLGFQEVVDMLLLSCSTAADDC